MDFHSMKRKQLQALCKKHKIPANLSNLELVNKLTEFLKEKEDPSIQRPIERDEEHVSEVETTDVVVSRKVKKVRFSPDHELIEFTRSPGVKRTRRNTVLSKYSSLSVEKLDSGEINKDNLGEQGRTTRSRRLKSLDDEVNEKKRGINAVNRNMKKSNDSAIEIFDNGKLKEGYVHSSGRVTLSREKKFEEGENNASKRENKRRKVDGKRDEKALDNVDNEKLIEKFLDKPCRVTRSRVQKLTSVSASGDQMGRKVVKRNGKVALVRAETEENRVAGTSSFVDRGGDLGERGTGKEKEKVAVLENSKIADERDVTEHQVILRRSKRNANRVADLEILNVDEKKHGDGDGKDLRQASNLLASNGETGSEVDLGKRALLKTEKLIKLEARKSNRRKNVIESDELKAEIENRQPLSSVPLLRTSGKVSKDDKKASVKLISADEEIETDLAVENLEVETQTKRRLRSLASQLGISNDQKKVFQPTGVVRRSERKPLSHSSANEEIDLDSVMQQEAEKQESEPFVVENECSVVQKNTRRSRTRALKCESPRLLNEVGEGSVIHQMDKVMKRKKSSISRRDVLKPNNDSSFVSETLKESTSKKALPAAATGEVADTRKRTCRLNDPKMLDAASHNGLEIKEPLIMNAKLSESECLGSISNLGFSTETGAAAIIIDAGLTSERKIRTKKSGISVADSAESSYMKLINGKELAISDTEATSGKKELKTDFEDQLSASNIKGVEKGYSQSEIGQNITDKDDSDAQMLSQTKGFHDKIDIQGLQEGSNGSGEEGLAETSSSADRLFLADLEAEEVEADKCLQPSSSEVDHAGEVKGFSVHENLDSDETGQKTDVLPQGSNVSGKEGCAEFTSTADSLLLDQTVINSDLEVAEGEDNTCLPPSPIVVDCVSEVKRIFVEENLALGETGQDNEVLPVVSNVSGKASFMETGSLANGLFLGDQTNIKTDLDVSEAESPSCVDIQRISLQDNLDSVEKREENTVLPPGSHISGNEAQLEEAETEGDKSIFVQENLDIFETRQANDISSPISCYCIDVDHLEACSYILDENIADTSLKVGEGFESPVRSIEYTHSKSTLKLRVSSSCIQRRLEADHMAEGNEACFQKNIASELAETNDDGAPITICIDSAEVNLRRGHEADHTPQKEETNTDKSINAEGGETVDGKSSKSDKGKCDEDRDFSVSNQFDAEGKFGIIPQVKVLSGEYFIKDCNELGIIRGSPSVAAMDLIAEGNDAFTYNVKQPELVDANESGCLKSHKSSQDEDLEFSVSKLFDSENIDTNGSGCLKNDRSSKGEGWELSISNLFDSGRSARISPQSRGIFSAEYSIKGCNEQVMFPELHSVSTMSAVDTEIQFSPDSSNFQQIGPVVSESQAEQPIQSLESWGNASETTGQAISLLKTNDEGNISQVVEGTSTDVDADGSRCGKDIENSAGPCITDVKISKYCAINKVEVEGLTDLRFQLAEETEQPPENLSRFSDVGEDPFSPSWTDMGLHNLFGTTLEDDTPRLNDTATQGTEENLTFSLNKSISSDRHSLIKNKENEMLGEMSEYAKTSNENVVSSTTSSDVPHTRYDVGMEENQLVTPINIDEHCPHEKILEKTVISSMGFFDTMKETEVTENMSNEKVQNIGCELENSFYLGDPLSDNAEDATCEELNEVESTELVNTTTASKGYEASEQQLTKNTGECLKENNLITEEDEGEKVNPVAGPCPNDEAPNDENEWTPNDENEWTEKSIISSSDSLRILDKHGYCLEMITNTILSGSVSYKGGVQLHQKSEGEMTQISEAPFKLSDSDIEKSNNVPEKKRHDLNACSNDCNILGETSIERGPLHAEVADCQKVETDKGTSPCLFSKVSPDYDEVAEAGNSIKDDDDPYGTNKRWDETDGNSRSCQDVVDEPYIKNEVVILELQSTSNEAKETDTTTQNLDNIFAPSEHGSSVRCSISGALSSSAMHLRLEDQENGGIEKPETRTPPFTFKRDHEKNGGEIEETSESKTVQFSIPQIHPEKDEDFKIYSHKISEMPSSGCNEPLSESDVADTIKEYIDSESSLCMIFENTGVSLPIDVLTHTDERPAGENSSSRLKEEDVVDRPAACSEGDDDKPSVYLETESKELEEPARCCEPSCVEFLAGGIDVKLDSEKQIESKDGGRPSSNQSCSIVKKNARTILIHGTPSKLLTMADMKENAPTRQGSNAGELTAVRPAKRKALQDVNWN